METNQSNAKPDVSPASIQDFGRRDPLEIGVQLRNLLNHGDFLTAHYYDGQFVTRILDVDAQERLFVFDWSALAEQNKTMLMAPRCTFQASPEGVRVEFTIGTPRETRFDGLPAFEAAFPEVLYYMQRREYFRIKAPVLDPYICRGRLPDGSPFCFEVYDLSLGGIGLRTADERAAELPIGTVLTRVDVRLNTHGTLSLDMQLVSRRTVDTPAGVHRHQLGFRFMSLPGHAENTLQRLITQIEMKRRSLMRA
jgi:c-di-GMP-binding flagellar brake protein YcgR